MSWSDPVNDNTDSEFTAASYNTILRLLFIRSSSDKGYPLDITLDGARIFENTFLTFSVVALTV